MRVQRDDRDFLLKIRSGEFEYEELMEMVEEKMETIKILYEQSQLPAEPDHHYTETLLIHLREEFYKLES